MLFLSTWFFLVTFHGTAMGTELFQLILGFTTGAVMLIGAFKFGVWTLETSEKYKLNNGAKNHLLE
jgi:hypothetical protein